MDPPSEHPHQATHPPQEPHDAPAEALPGSDVGEGSATSPTFKGTQLIEEDYPDADGEEQQEEEEEEEADIWKRPWAKIMFEDPDRRPVFQELMRKAQVGDEGRLHEYTLGRDDSCDIKFDSHPSISSIHCKIFCKRIANLSDERMEAYIVDVSSNGTYVNGQTKLPKNAPRKLIGNEEIALLTSNTKIKTQGSRPSEKQVQAATFIVQLLFNFTTAAQARRARTATLRAQSLTQAEVEGLAANMSMQRNSSLYKLLKSERTFRDFYDLGELKGQGACGAVYEALNKHSGQKLAVKIVDIKKHMFSSSVSAIDSLVSEAEIARKFDHPGLIKVEDLFGDSRSLYIVMELLEGGDLFDRIVAKKRYDEPLAKQVFRRILQAVEYMHKVGVVHRDLKPENILLVNTHSDIDVKITDFGLAKRTGAEGLKTFCGTPQYFAPEVLNRRDSFFGVGRYDTSADVWSLGVILFVLLVGYLPFREATLEEDVKKGRVNFNDPRWNDVTITAKNLVENLLKSDPAQRLTCSEALQHPWFQEAEDSPEDGSNTDCTSHSNATKRDRNSRDSSCSISEDISGPMQAADTAGSKRSRSSRRTNSPMPKEDDDRTSITRDSDHSPGKRSRRASGKHTNPSPTPESTTSKRKKHN